jgi:hypothetical protein
MSYTFQLVSTDGEILETFKTAEQRWARRVTLDVPGQALFLGEDGEKTTAHTRSSTNRKGPFAGPFRSG